MFDLLRQDMKGINPRMGHRHISVELTFKDTHLTNTATIFLISIPKVQLSNCSADPTDNIIQTAICYGLKTIKAIIQQIGYVFKLIFTRMVL